MTFNGEDVDQRYLQRYYDAMQVDKLVRPMLPKGRSLLFHGTRSPWQILGENKIRIAESGIPAVFLTRLSHVAVYWATLERESETVGAILVLDKERLAQRYRLYVCSSGLTPYGVSGFGRKVAEAEERVGIDIERVNEYIIDIIWLDDDGRIQSTKFQRAKGLRNRALLQKCFPLMSHARGQSMACPQLDVLPLTGQL